MFWQVEESYQVLERLLLNYYISFGETNVRIRRLLFLWNVCFIFFNFVALLPKHILNGIVRFFRGFLYVMSNQSQRLIDISKSLHKRVETSRRERVSEMMLSELFNDGDRSERIHSTIAHFDESINFWEAYHVRQLQSNNDGLWEWTFNHRNYNIQTSEEDCQMIWNKFYCSMEVVWLIDKKYDCSIDYIRKRCKIRCVFSSTCYEARRLRVWSLCNWFIFFQCDIIYRTDLIYAPTIVSGHGAELLSWWLVPMAKQSVKRESSSEKPAYDFFTNTLSK